jgi:hypothetical protein
MVVQVQRETRAVRHRSSKYLWVHLRDLERIFLPLRIECIDRVLQDAVLRTVQLVSACQAALTTASAQVTRGVRQACLWTTSCPSKTSTMQVNSMRPSLGTPLTLYSGALVVGIVGDSLS